MFNKNFYPSPQKAIDLLLEGMELYENSRVLEPSAGKGDLAKGVLKYANTHSYKTKMDVVELEPELCSILEKKGFTVSGKDFLHFNTYTEYDQIIMNPPFDEGAKHLLHAIKLAENQAKKECEIRAILNAETIKNAWSAERKKLAKQLQKYEAKVTFHDGLFRQAERTTNVESAIVKMKINTTKQSVNDVYENLLKSTHVASNETITDSLVSFVQPQELSEIVADIEGLIKRYEFHVSLVKDLYRSQNSIQYLETLLEKERDTKINSLKKYDYDDVNEVIEGIRRQYWSEILQTKEFAQHLTQHSRNKIYQQLESSGKLEINIENIEILLRAVMQNAGALLLESCVSMFDKMTKHHNKEYSNNIHYYDGWDTNDAFKVNKKVILPVDRRYSGFSLKMGEVMCRDGRPHLHDEYDFDLLDIEVKSYMKDLNKAFAVIDSNFKQEFKPIGRGEFENELFRFKLFNKGTMHIWFKNLEVLERFNIICGQQKNWVPSDEEMRQNPAAREFIAKKFKKMKQLATDTRSSVNEY